MSSTRICSATSRSSQSSISRPPTSCCAGIRSDPFVLGLIAQSYDELGDRAKAGNTSARCWRRRCTTSIRHSRVRRRGRFCVEPARRFRRAPPPVPSAASRRRALVPALARRSAHHERDGFHDRCLPFDGEESRNRDRWHGRRRERGSPCSAQPARPPRQGPATRRRRRRRPRRPSRSAATSRSSVARRAKKGVR